MSDIDPLNIKKILIIIVSRIGDTLLTTPAIKSVADYYKDAEITILAHPKRYTILKHLPYVYRVGSISKKNAPWKGRFGKKYDLALVYGFDEKLVEYALRVSGKTIAFSQKNSNLNGRLYRSVQISKTQSKTSVDSMMALPQAINIDITTRRLSYCVTERENQFAEKKILNKGLKGKFLIGLQVASFPTKAFRDWPIEYFLELCNKVSEKKINAHFLIYGSYAEKEKADWLFERLGNRATSFIGMPLRETAAIMSKTSLYIGVDTGPTHIMSTFDIPMIVLFFCKYVSKNVGTFGHPSLFNIDHPDGDNCTKNSNMRDITVYDVMTEVNKIL
jgi:heptosyltransferase-3